MTAPHLCHEVAGHYISVVSVNSPHILEAVMEAVILSGLQAAKDPYS